MPPAPRRPACRAALLATLLVAAPAAFAARPTTPAPALPQPAPGLWQVQSQVAELGNLPMRWKICVGNEPLAKLLARTAKQERCSEHSVRRNADGQVRVTMRCQVQSSQVHSEGLFAGDLRQSFSGTLHSVFTPPWQGLTQANAQISGQRLGNCAPGQRPGIIVQRELPNADDILRSADSLLRNLR